MAFLQETAKKGTRYHGNAALSDMQASARPERAPARLHNCLLRAVLRYLPVACKPRYKQPFMGCAHLICSGRMVNRQTHATPFMHTRPDSFSAVSRFVGSAPESCRGLSHCQMEGGWLAARRQGGKRVEDATQTHTHTHLS